MHKRHRILIIGTGSIGERHTRCFGLTDRCEVGIVETNERLRGDVAARYAIKQHYSSIDDALNDRWHAAVVATPANTHVAIAQRLAEKKIHLFIEKPLSISLEGVNELARTAAANRLVAGVAYVYRSHPLARRMREIIRSSQLGAPRHLYVTAGQNFPFYRPAYRDIYYAHRQAGGGAIQDALTHLINLGEWLVGPTDRLAADAAHQLLAGVEVEDTAHVIARQGDVLASYSLNQYQAPNETIITVVCESGALRLFVQKGELTSMTKPGGEWHVELTTKLERDDWFVAQANAFLDALDGRAPVLCSIDDATHTLRATLAILGCVDDPANLRKV